MRTSKIEVVPYDVSWTKNFLEIKNEILKVLDKLVLSIEHVGSTAVCGLWAKPIIDIDVVIKDYSMLSDVVLALNSIGYTYEGNLGIEGREAFTYEGKEHLKKHHLYVCPKDSIELRKHVTFRDYLRTHPEAQLEYSKIKQQGAKLYPYDVDKYIEYKSFFIKKIYQKLGF
ncbi:UPF0157-domain-containing protein [Anaeromyces robustus]|uniref:UPF0157-domain-containing protein n=1 Tax=Anaeromyces robustus TaxID=1754192 RepID=A0A1Y1XK60_9FUNG|nr:UPF0157-domain-containing protein [Anaeromyces robustus]|eukprot:ORX86105.1 UPF0157-domain-containing protein [Anaeromyces robustus]